jgi:hypothetical protein
MHTTNNSTLLKGSQRQRVSSQREGRALKNWGELVVTNKGRWMVIRLHPIKQYGNGIWEDEGSIKGGNMVLVVEVVKGVVGRRPTDGCLCTTRGEEKCHAYARAPPLNRWHGTKRICTVGDSPHSDHRRMLTCIADDRGWFYHHSAGGEHFLLGWIVWAKPAQLSAALAHVWFSARSCL